MNVLSLFSGVGGFDLGLEQAGMTTIYQCEWDKHATNILNRHWPHTPKWGDITTLTAQEILSHGTPPDVVAWGSPCQDLSVAGKRAGLEGERSGLFHEGMRLIRELRKETNNEYPRISIWENVAGALSSNNGADFGVILDEMAEAGAMVIEWSLLDAQYFGIPQRRRRVFVVAIFDPAIAVNCPDPLLPVSESVRRDSAKGKSKGQAASRTLTEGVGGDGAIVNAIGASIYHKSTVVNQDVNSGHLVVGALAARDYKGVGSQYVDEGKVIVEQSAFKFDSLSSNSMKSSNPNSGCNEVEVAPTLDTWEPNPSLNQGGLAIVEPFVKSRRAQTSEDDKTWVEGEINPTLNSFDIGDTRATTAIVGSVEMVNRPVKDPVGTLQARVAATNHESIRDGHAIVEEAILLDGRRVDDVRVYDPPVQTLQARMGTGGNNVPVIGFSHTQGLSPQASEDAWPTLRTEENGMAVAIPIDTRNALRDPEKYDAQNRQGLGIGEDGDPMATLTSTHVNAVAYDEYNDSINETHHALRAGTKQSTGVLEPTMAVRRLTPLECERLMGWPDDHTRWKADGSEQADTHRYKQCGNGVASPVARWIAQHILNIPRNPA